MKRLGQDGDIEGLRAHLKGQSFERAWAVATPTQRIHLCAAVVAASREAEARTRKPLPKPQRRGGKLRWDAVR
jgi:hypothetical protein